MATDDVDVLFDRAINRLVGELTGLRELTPEDVLDQLQHRALDYEAVGTSYAVHPVYPVYEPTARRPDHKRKRVAEHNHWCDYCGAPMDPRKRFASARYCRDRPGRGGPSRCRQAAYRARKRQNAP
jgi:hypothetical protein